MFTEHLIHASDQVLGLRDLMVSKTACLVFMAHMVTYKEVNKGVPGLSPRLFPSFSLTTPLEFPYFKESPLFQYTVNTQWAVHWEAGAMQWAPLTQTGPITVGTVLSAK